MNVLRQDRQRMAMLYRRVQVGVRKTSPATCAKATPDTITQACHDVIVDNLVLHKGHFHCADLTSEAFDNKLAGFLVVAAINRLRSATRKHMTYDNRFGTRLDDVADQPQAANPHSVPPQHSSWQPDNDDLHVHALLGGDHMTAADQQRATLLDNCINCLTDLARKTYRLAILGCNDRDIQAKLDVASASTVRRRIHDAHKRVMDCVQRKITTGGVA